MADGGEEDASQLPYTDRFGHKNWKIRKEGYEAAAKEFEPTTSESDPVFKQFLQDPSLWKNAASDSNVAAQQEGLVALGAFLKYGGPQAASRTRGYAVEAIREKGLSSTRPAAKAAAVEALLLYIELDKPDMVIDELLPALSQKQPKVIAATLAAFTTIYHNFGTKIVDPKPVLKQLPKVFGHADKNVRAEATNLAVELYRWLREAIKAIFWGDLKPVQQQDLEKLFEKVREEPNPKQERRTRAQQAADAVAEETPNRGIGDGDEEDFGDEQGEEPAAVSAFDLAEPVDVFAKMPKDLHTSLASSKWKDRKDALDELLAAIDTPRIKDGHYDELVRDLAKIVMKDANVAVVVVAANCVEKLALGLRRGFAKHRSTIIPSLLERCKEKKQSVTDALATALDAVFASTSVSECLEDILGFLAHKNPQVRLETVRFLTRCLRNTPDVPSKSEVKSIADAATKLLTESTEAMRSGGAEILGTLMKIMGERAMGPYLDGLDDIRKSKIREYFENAVVKAKDRPKPMMPPTKAPGNSVVNRKTGGPGVKKPLGPARTNPTTAGVPAEEEHGPLKPQSTGRSGSKPAQLRTGSGLSVPAGSKLAALKKPSSSGPLSPQKRVVSPPVAGGNEPPAPSPSKLGMGRGGLAGRSLSKPVAASSSGDSANGRVPSPLHAGSPAMDRAELEELRAEKQRLLDMTESLRSSNSTLTAEISELQNQNAQLIEDHTRDVLQIKAKETQLVRSRGECEVLRTELDSAKKEIERQKREMSRLGRENFGREQKDVQSRDIANASSSAAASPQEESSQSGTFSEGANETLKEPYGKNGGATAATKSTRPTASIPSRTGSSASASSIAGKLISGSRNASYRDRFDSQQQNNNNHHLGVEEKENVESDANLNVNLKVNSAQSNSYYGNRATSPQRSVSSDANGGDSLASSSSTTTTTAGVGGGGAEPAENWKRAAEVTSQLKARIEQMKVSRTVFCRWSA